MKNKDKNTPIPQCDKNAVMPCALSELEIAERNYLLELQKSSTRWFSQDEFDRLKYLSNKMFLTSGDPHKA